LNYLGGSQTYEASGYNFMIGDARTMSVFNGVGVNTNTSTNINGNIYVFGNNTITGNTLITDNTTTTGISKTFNFTGVASSGYQISGNLFTIHPTLSNGIITTDTIWNIAATPDLQESNSINVFVDYVNVCLKSFYDISYNHNNGNGNTYSYPISSSYLSYKSNTIVESETLYYDYTLTVIVNKTLTQNDYSMNLIEGTGGNLWSNDLSFNSSYNLNNNYIAESTYSQVTNNKAVGAYTCTLSKDTTINVKGIKNGVYSSGGENDIYLNISAGTYTRIELFTAINNDLYNNPLTTGSVINTKTINGYEFVYFHFNINKIFNASDYRIVFYDIYSFVKCYEGYKKDINSTFLVSSVIYCFTMLFKTIYSQTRSMRDILS
jgi:hypothetical protein